MKTLTEKQLAAWNRPHEYVGRGYFVVIQNGEARGHFNSRDGESVSRFKFQYNPVRAEQPCPEPQFYWEAIGQPCPEPAHGWLIMGSGDSYISYEVPQVAHPDELYQWLREKFGYPRTVMIRG